jgi:hypothetical protein
VEIFIMDEVDYNYEKVKIDRKKKMIKLKFAQAL